MTRDLYSELLGRDTVLESVYSPVIPYRCVIYEWDAADESCNMRKPSAKKKVDELRPEYDLSKLKGGIRGKYYKRAMAGTNLVLIEPDLAKAFPDTDSVNRALRLLVDAASSATTRRRQRRSGSNKRIKRTA
jgi:hypothetical protein